MRRGQETAPEAPEPRSESKEFMTKAEYNRWLLRQENAKLADDLRESAKAGEEVIKERQRQHTTRGLARQQAAMVQMKRASESLEAHRQQNLTHGRKVYEEVAGWRVGAKETKEAWSAYGKTIKEKQKTEDGATQAKEQLSETKKQQAAKTRLDDQNKEAERERLKKERETEVKVQAQTVRESTADAVTDGAKRMFFEQRLKAANETKSNSAMYDKTRKENDATFREAQSKKRAAGRATKDASAKSRAALLTSRSEDAAKLRETKMSLREMNKERMQEEYLEKSALVKAVITNKIYNEGEATGSPGLLTSPPRSPKGGPPSGSRPTSPGTRGSTGSRQAAAEAAEDA